MSIFAPYQILKIRQEVIFSGPVQLILRVNSIFLSSGEPLSSSKKIKKLLNNRITDKSYPLTIRRPGGRIDGALSPVKIS